MMEVKYQDLVDDYLLDRMDEQERIKFEEELAVNPTLRKLLDDTRMIQRAVIDISSKRKLMQEWSKDLTFNKPDRSIRWWYYGVAAAAVITAAVVLTVPIDFQADKYVYRQIDMGANFKGVGPTIEIEQLLLKKNYADALTQVQSLIESVQQEMAQLDSKPDMRPDERKYLREMAAHRLAQLEWFKANALIGLDRIPEAKPLLEKLRHETGPIPAAADSLLHTLK